VFLDDLISRPVQDRSGWRGVGLFVGEGQLALEVVVYESQAKPAAGAMQEAWRERRGGRSAPVLIIVLHGDEATIAGPSGEDLPVQTGIETGTAERLCRAALEQPDRHAALLFLAQAIPSLQTAGRLEAPSWWTLPCAAGAATEGSLQERSRVTCHRSA
jgi:hypothetical protein